MECYEAFNQNNNTFPVIVSIPHSGTHVPEDVRKQMKPEAILPNTDWFLPELYCFLSDMGVTMLVANINRNVIDLNRSPYRNIVGDYHSLIYLNNTHGSPLYNQALTQQEISLRIERYYKPYHRALNSCIEQKLVKYPKILLLDLHSFFKDFTEVPDGNIILSDADHTCSALKTFTLIKNSFEMQGYSISENTIKGGFITTGYKASWGHHIETIQIELRYSDYLGKRHFGEEEVTSYDEPLFRNARLKLKKVFNDIILMCKP